MMKYFSTVPFVSSIDILFLPFHFTVWLNYGRMIEQHRKPDVFIAIKITFSVSRFIVFLQPVIKS